MKIIQELFTDFFENKQFTNDRLNYFGHEHVFRMQNNNPGNIFDALISETETVLDAFGLLIGGEGGNIGDRKATVTQKNLKRKDFHDFISLKEGVIKGTFGGETSTPYQQFFPMGLTPFQTTAKDVVFANGVDNIVSRAAQYETELGTPFKTLVDSMSNAFSQSIAAMLDEKTQVAASSDALLAGRQTLTLQYCKNALTIALAFLGQPEKANLYFNTMLLYATHHKHIYKGKPAAGATAKVHDIEYDAGKNLHGKNKGASALRVQFWLNGAPVGNYFDMAPGGELIKKFSDFFTNADAIYITNLGTALGDYEITVLA